MPNKKYFLILGLLDYEEYNFPDSSKILGDLEIGQMPNLIILTSKKEIFNSFETS